MAHAPQQDSGALTKAFFCGASANAGAPSLVTAAGTGDNTEVTGATIDRYQGTSMLNSGKLVISYLAALDTAETISFKVDIADSEDNSSWATDAALLAATVVNTGLGNKSGVYEVDVDLTSYDRYVRFSVTPNLSRGATDTAVWTACFVAGGVLNSSDI